MKNVLIKVIANQVVVQITSAKNMFSAYLIALKIQTAYQELVVATTNAKKIQYAMATKEMESRAKKTLTVKAESVLKVNAKKG